MLEWMAWTTPTAIFFIAIACLLIAMTVLERLIPTTERVGWLRISTMRGERLFISLLATGWINIFWIAFTNASQWIALIIGLAISAIILARG